MNPFYWQNPYLCLQKNTMSNFCVNRYNWIYFLWGMATMCVNHNLFAQNYTLQLHLSDSQTLKTQIFEQKDSVALLATLDEQMKLLQQKDYWSSSIDSLAWSNHKLDAYIFVGKSYTINSLQTSPNDVYWLQAVGYKTNTSMSFVRWQQLQERLLRYAENHAYPFAKVGLTNVGIDEQGKLSAELVIDKQTMILYDSLRYRGDVRLSRNFLQRYLGIKLGGRYNESRLQEIDQRLNELTFLRTEKPTQILFVADRAEIYLSLKRQRNSRFDVLLGVVPRNESVAGGATQRTRYDITGEGDLGLQNALGAGETIEINFKSFQNQSRQFKAHFLYPYLPTLPFGGDARFELQLRDTTSREVLGVLALQYLLKGNNYLKVFWQTQNAVLLGVDSIRLVSTLQLPANLDYKIQQYGIEQQWEKLDYRLNPRRGWQVWSSLGVGQKKVVTNNRILELGELAGKDFSLTYDSLNQNRLQTQLQYKVARYSPIGKRSTIKTQLRGGYLLAKRLFKNETYRLGGGKTLRGFDEQSILATHYHLLTAEYRFMLAKNATFFTFGDAAYIADQSEGSTQTPAVYYGTGLGLQLDTKAGVFGLSYAIGKTPLLPFQLRAARVHLGYVSYF